MYIRYMENNKGNQMKNSKKTCTWNDAGYSCTFEYKGTFDSGNWHIIMLNDFESKNVSDSMFKQYYTIN